MGESSEVSERPASECSKERERASIKCSKAGEKGKQEVKQSKLKAAHTGRQSETSGREWKVREQQEISSRKPSDKWKKA